jgi:hypothetical protein
MNSTIQIVFYRDAIFRLSASYFSCFAKKSNQKKATPTIVLILRCSEKSGTKKLASLKQFSVLIAFFLRFSGAIHGDLRADI